MKKRLTTYPLKILIFLWPTLAMAHISVIVQAKNDENLDQSQIKNIFMGKTKTFPSGKTVKPLDQNDDSLLKKVFYIKLADKDEKAMKVYWSNLIFTGDGTPPKSLSGDVEVKKYVSENLSAIGYIDSKFVDDTVRVILVLNTP